MDKSARRSYASTAFDASQARTGSNVIPTSLIVATFFGFLLVVFLVLDSGAAEIARAMLVLGWWLLPISLFISFLYPSALSRGAS